MNEIIQAQVNPRLLSKASRLFTGTLDGRIIEILQNARRAGATRVYITNRGGYVTVQDNGRGIQDFARLLDMGGSDWDERFEASEDPAGVGLFCLSPREVSIRSNGKLTVIHEAGWTGAPVHVVDDVEPVKGTRLYFQDDPWTVDIVKPLAVFSGLKVTVDREECPTERFIDGDATHDARLGARFQIVGLEQMSEWHKQVARVGAFGSSNVVVNFHGQTVGFNYRALDEHNLHYLVELTGEPAGIRLMLPARTQLVENEAFGQLKQVLERESYLYLKRKGRHHLPYKQYQRAKELGIDLPEAEPRFQVGLLTGDIGPDPVEVAMPKDHPLERCYRLADGAMDQVNEENAHLLAAVGKFANEGPFIPVVIHRDYDGYQWAKLPTIERVDVTLGKERHESWVGRGAMTCVESIVLAAYTSDGKVFRSNVPMAIRPPKEDPNGTAWYSNYDVYVTEHAREHLTDSEIWYHFGGYSDEGDTFDTQEFEFTQELDRFWAQLYGPDEPIRCKLMDAVEGFKDNWQSVTILPNGYVTIRFRKGKEKTLVPPRRKEVSS